MAARRPKPAPRRTPKQARSLQTVDAILQAVVKLLKRGGVDAITTNRIAEIAGVSVGSVYQYFPDKRAIFLALHDRHAEEMGRLIDATVVAHADARLDRLVRALVQALVDAHTPDPELYALLDAEVPHRSAGARSLQVRLRNALRLALGAHRAISEAAFERTLFVVAHMIDALAHGVVLDRPRHLSLAAAVDETVTAVMAYLRARPRVRLPRDGGSRTIATRPA